MTKPRRVTVNVTVSFVDMGMETTDEALEVVKSVMLTHGESCREEIQRAMESAGARDVTISMLAF